MEKKCTNCGRSDRPTCYGDHHDLCCDCQVVVVGNGIVPQSEAEFIRDHYQSPGSTGVEAGRWNE